MDRCVECGYCEPVCPRKDITLTPRQRIVLRREMAAAEAPGDDELAGRAATGVRLRRRADLRGRRHVPDRLPGADQHGRSRAPLARREPEPGDAGRLEGRRAALGRGQQSRRRGDDGGGCHAGRPAESSDRQPAGRSSAPMSCPNTPPTCPREERSDARSRPPTPSPCTSPAARTPCSDRSGRTVSANRSSNSARGPESSSPRRTISRRCAAAHRGSPRASPRGMT